MQVSTQSCQHKSVSSTAVPTIQHYCIMHAAGVQVPLVAGQAVNTNMMQQHSYGALLAQALSCELVASGIARFNRCALLLDRNRSLT